MQVRTDRHMSTVLEEACRDHEHTFNDDMKRFFKLFTESTFEGSKAAARKMKKIATRETTNNQKAMLLHSLILLIHTKSEKLLWPNSPLLVLLQFVDPNRTLHNPLAFLVADCSDYLTYENQVILGRQLIKHGANVNAVDMAYPNGEAYPNGDTPLHSKCHSTTATSLDFIQLLLENGADPNAQDHWGRTPFINTMPWAPGAAKFLLEWPTTDVNITTRSGASFPTMVRETVAYVSEHFSDKVLLPDNPDWVKKTLSSSSGVKSKRCWWKGEDMIPGSRIWSRTSSRAINDLQSRVPVR
jgi:hypothetical protein